MFFSDLTEFTWIQKFSSKFLNKLVNIQFDKWSPLTKYRIMDILPFATLSGGIAYVSIASGIMEGESIPFLRWYKKCNNINGLWFWVSTALYNCTIQFRGWLSNSLKRLQTFSYIKWKFTPTSHYASSEKSQASIMVLRAWALLEGYSRSWWQHATC